MKKKQADKLKLSIYGRWKSWKRPSFTFYFVIATTALVFVTVVLALVISNLIAEWSRFEENVWTFLVLIGASLIIGFGLSWLVGYFLITPISNLQSIMNKVAEGNLSVEVEEKNSIEEVENINHSFNLMIKELRSNYEMQKDFVSNVSHEFKTPINAIEGYATLLQDETLSEEEEREYVEKILLNTRRLSDLVGNILLLSKVDNQAIPASRATYSLDEQIRRAILYLEPKWEKKNILFDVELDTVDYYGNESLMLHIWTNLLDNAIKFSPEGGEVRVRLYEKDGNAVFSVSDQGAGIDENAKKHIFDKFYQSETSHKGEGNGLGLALVKRITDLAGGTVTAENLSLGGCRFEVIFPNIKQ